ncbi:PREDICTED: nucleolar protein 58 [Tarenaya hassleriana]|uniref:nucleolar protein 58 n=1 Tax=Tarenaya hassleriana TaxID=28532 RepID=UPI00053C389B|nr:PREDICTED: nucleolar protein 58 [Tarenaya hassleriana]XP_019056356.1 PREDICTED: nucleolar protein 58 [Tarenaya hassleriana]
MKTVTGRVISAGPISVSKAASILSKFASSENGATQAVCAYLRRATVAFNELKGIHRDLKASNLKEKKPRSDVTLVRNPTLASDEPGRPDDMSEGAYDGNHHQKKLKKKEKESGGDGDLVNSGGEIGGRESKTVGEQERSHERVQVSQGPSRDGESEIKEGKKKNKKNREGDENFDGGEVKTRVEAEDEHRKEEKKEKKKKRKSGGEIGSEEKKSKKKRQVKE